MRYTTVLFDLDGTISDSAGVITDALRRTLRHFGVDAPDDRALRRAVGPPIAETLRRYIGSDHVADAALEHCRSVYTERMTAAPLFPGIAEVIADLRAEGVPVAVATSKTEASARAIVDAARLDIPVVAGAVGGVADKAAVIRRALGALDDLCLDTRRPVMVGDREHDVRGAAAVGVDSIGVAWGCAEPGELDTATTIVRTPAELAEVIRTGA